MYGLPERCQVCDQEPKGSQQGRGRPRTMRVAVWYWLPNATAEQCKWYGIPEQGAVDVQQG